MTLLLSLIALVLNGGLFWWLTPSEPRTKPIPIEPMYFDKRSPR